MTWLLAMPPWGAGVITDDASTWATRDDRNWTIPYNDIGGLFLAKGAELVSENGRIALGADPDNAKKMLS